MVLHIHTNKSLFIEPAVQRIVKTEKLACDITHILVKNSENKQLMFTDKLCDRKKELTTRMARGVTCEAMVPQRHHFHHRISYRFFRPVPVRNLASI